jgi:hypothetical protein
MSMNSPTGGSKNPEGADGVAGVTAALLFLSLVQFFHAGRRDFKNCKVGKNLKNRQFCKL